MKIPFPSLRKSQFQVSSVPCQHSCPPCCPLSELCGHSWQCHHLERAVTDVTDSMAGTSHVPKPARHSSLMGNSIWCSGSIPILDFQGLESLWRAVFVGFVFGCVCLFSFFKPIGIYLVKALNCLLHPSPLPFLVCL